jgi:hypothetical protein
MATIRKIDKATHLEYVDKALYYAKVMGRNRVVLYDDLPHAGQDTNQADIELF